MNPLDQESSWFSSRLARYLLVCLAGAVVAQMVPAQSSASTGIAPVASVEAVDVETDPPADQVMVPELSTATSTTYLLENGWYSLDATTDVVNYQDASGEWQPVDTTLVDAPGSTYAVENAEADFVAKIPQNPEVTPVKVAADGAWVTMRMHGLTDAPVVEDAVATFDNVEDAAAVAYEATGEGLKESIVLAEAPSVGAPLEYVYDIATSPGLTPRLTAAGAVEFVDTTGTVRFVVPRGDMLDSAEPAAYSTAVSYTLAPSGSGWTLRMTPDVAWLTNPARVYPVTIDPTLLRQHAPNSGRDCVLMQDSATTIKCGTDRLEVGRVNAGTLSRRRPVLFFDVSVLSSVADVQHANVELNLDSSKTTTGNPADYKMCRTDRAFSNGATWNSSGSSGAWAGGNPWGCAGTEGTLWLSGTAAQNGWRYFNVADIVRAWKNGETNNGLVLLLREQQSSCGFRPERAAGRDG